MIRFPRVIPVLMLAIAFSCAAQTSPFATKPDEAQALSAFAALHPIDAHVHVFKTDPAFLKMLARLNLKVLDILVSDDTVPYRKQLQSQVDDALALVKSSKGHVALCTTFDPYAFNNPSFTADSVKQLKKTFAQGAIAVKIWKNIGMEIKDPSGNYIMADDPKFDAIYLEIERQGKTLISHQAEPDVAWGPADPSDPSWSYYQENPQWYVGDKPGFPPKQKIIDARDHVLEKYPKLRNVGVHLGSMERSLDTIAAHLDKYPNFAIDTAGRLDYMMLMPTDKLRAFLIKYQDRVLYGTDLDVLADANVPETLKEWEAVYARDWKFFATDLTFTVDGKPVHGLNLPKPVLEKILHGNAIHWIPGL